MSQQQWPAVVAIEGDGQMWCLPCARQHFGQAWGLRRVGTGSRMKSSTPCLEGPGVSARGGLMMVRGAIWCNANRDNQVDHEWDWKEEGKRFGLCASPLRH